MYLKTLELIGFKSFAEKTRLEFPTGVTAIVGPNGCGKSNILDAIRWVLGEQSAKALRGSEMADVIFSGSDQRKQVGMAEVSLTFADCEKELGTDYHEITISRRVFRDGHGEYELNKSLCRLRDIQQLFMDTGIGRSAYSIMEQGKIDKILSARPEDRREIFEEAAGITKYKAQKKEALRKLDNTEANLIRLNDILSEVKRQINSLQRQAGKARRYKELYDQLKTLEAQLGYHQSSELQQHLQKIEAQIHEIVAEMEKITLEIGQLEILHQDNRQQWNNFENQLDVLRQQQMEMHSAIDRSQNRLSLNEERLIELDQQDRQAHLDSAGAEERVRIQTEQLAQLDQEIDLLQNQLNEQQLSLQNNQQKTSEAQQTLQAHLQLLLQIEMQLSAKENELYPINQQLSHRDAEQRTALLRVETIKNEAQSAQEFTNNLSQQKTSFENQIQTLKSTFHSTKQQLSDQQQQQQNLDLQLTQLKQENQSLEHNRLELQLQRDLIEKLQTSHQEFTPAIQQIFQAHEKGELPNLSSITTLAEVIKVLPNNELAVEALLQHKLETLFINDIDEALQIIDFLKAQQSDQVKLAPLSFTRPTANIDFALPESAIHQIVIAEPYQSLIQSLFSESYITNTLQEAIKIKKNMPSATIATHQGELISRDGLIQVGPLSQRLARLNRQEEINQLAQEMVSFERQLETSAEQIVSIGEKEAGFKAQIEITQQTLQSLREEIVSLERDLHLCSHQIETAQQKIHLSENEVNQITKIEQIAVEKYQIQLEERTQLEAEKIQLQESLQSNREKLPSFQEQENKFSQELTENRVILASYEEKLKGFFHQNETNTQRLQELKKNLEDSQNTIRLNQEKRLQLHQENDSLKKETARLQIQLDEKEQSLTTLQVQRNDLQQVLEEQQRSLQQKQKQQTQWQQQRSQNEVKLAKHQLEIQNLKERLLHTYQINLDADKIDLPSLEQDWAQIQQQTHELRAKLEAMGPVNLEAVSEYDELEKRFQFLESQQKDLLESKQHLFDAIAFVNRTTKKLFVETFEQVRQNFQTTFTELFGGGKANLLLSQEDDPLECGIEIVAKPPGKQPQSVALLSGGERTMTAVALLFAIYMVKPSPFCVLDEMDAPLDESNIDRFLKILQRFLHQSQFLLITHNKKTISMADTLYGVTMEEQGLSKLVSVKLKKKENQTNFVSSQSEPITPKTTEEINAEEVSLDSEVSVAA